MEIIKQINGHSGCRVLLCSDHEKKFIRKTSFSLEYNSRLKAQMEKQHSFNHFSIKTPAILDNGEDVNGLFYFDMEFVNGVPLSQFVFLNSPEVFSVMFGTILSYVTDVKDDKITDCNDCFVNKIRSVAGKLPERYLPMIRYCLSQEWNQVPTGICHGDFTLENIIVFKNNLYFIDFLDSFVESKILDSGKLMMDLITMWSWRGQHQMPIVKSIYLYNNLISKLNNHFIELIHSAVILNLLRIVLYATSETEQFLYERILIFFRSIS